MSNEVIFKCRYGSTNYAVHINADRMWSFLQDLYVAMADFHGGVYDMQYERIVEVYKQCGLWNQLTDAPFGVHQSLADDIRKKREDIKNEIEIILGNEP